MKISAFKYKRFVFDNYGKNISENLCKSAAIIILFSVSLGWFAWGEKVCGWI